jgi:lactate dehydrogenase-like 2-hydroxyacid dehydrogenase
VALVNHLKANPNFKCGLDVFEDEPAMKPGLRDCPNAVIVPHIASASMWTRGGMVSDAIPPLSPPNIHTHTHTHAFCGPTD